jgi:hypothetical protein
MNKNNTQKLYYSCPLEAAYMAKNFGVKFNGADYETLCLLASDNYKLDADFFVLPDSLSIFEPQVGDTVFNGEIHYDIEQLQTAQYYQHHIKHSGFEIRSRNGRPFIMPQQE